jgi:hypothetical protein
VIALENMGNEQLVYLALGNQVLVARRSPVDAVESGDEKKVRITMDAMIFFDSESGQVIAW